MNGRTGPPCPTGAAKPPGRTDPGLGRQPHRRRDREPPRLAHEASGLESRQRFATAARRMVQRVGKVQPLAQIAQCRLDRRTIFDLDVGQRQQVFDDAAHILGRVALHATQHPFEFDHDGLRDEQLCAALDHGARGLLLCARGAAFAHVLARQHVGIQFPHQRLPPRLGASRLAASKSAGSRWPRASSMPNPDSTVAGARCSTRNSTLPFLLPKATRLPCRIPSWRRISLGMVTWPLLVTVAASSSMCPKHYDVRMVAPHLLLRADEVIE